MRESDTNLPHGSAEIPVDASELTRDAFWELHGTKFDPEIFPRQSFDTVWDFAEEHSADFERHNFNHAKEVLWAVMDLTDYCEGNGETVDRVALVLAALTHDNGVGEDHEALGFSSEEEYAAALCEEIARSLDPELPEQTIATAQQVIRDTAVDAEPIILEGKIMVNGDLQNIGEDYETSFIPVTKKLWQEYKQRKKRLGNKASDTLFIKASIGVLNRYIAKDLSLGPFDSRNWHTRAKQNIERLNNEFQSVLSHAKRSPADIGSTAVRTVIDHLPLKDKELDDSN